MKKLYLTFVLFLLHLILFSQEENDLFTQFSSDDILEIDFDDSGNDDTSGIRNDLSLKSSVYSAKSIDSELEIRRQIDRYFQEIDFIKYELIQADEMVMQGRTDQLISEIQRGRFNNLKVYSDSIKEGDDLYVVSHYGFEHRLSEDAVKYINEAYHGRPNLEEEIEKYEYLNSQFNLEVEEFESYKMEVDPWTIYRDDPGLYAEYLMSLIGQVLRTAPSLNCTFDQYKTYENAQNISSLNNLISFRYSFLSFCYAKIN